MHNKFYLGNYPNSSEYDPSLPIGFFSQLASYYEDDSEDFYHKEEEEEDYENE